jgi:glycosyltransferase involved in cell wall biosynthesis
VDDVIRALPSVPDAELLVAGGRAAAGGGPDPDLVRLYHLARRVGVGTRVRLLGPVQRSSMPALLRSADTVVDAPWFTAFGSVLLEAMACRRPVVATAVGGVRDIVADQITGLLVPPRRPDELARTLRAVLTEATMPEAYGIAGRDRILARYAWPRIATATAAAYCQVVEGHAEAAAGSGQAMAGPRSP